MDARRALLTAQGFRAAGELVAAEAERLGAAAVGGPTLGADPIACSVLCASDRLKAFFVRKERKEHGLQRWIEGPPIEPGERALVVEDVVTSGGSLITAIERVREEGSSWPARSRSWTGWRAAREAIEEALGAGLPYVSLLHDRRRVPGPPRPLRRVRRAAGMRDAPSRIRTCGLLLRRESLCPAELSGLARVLRG